MLVLINSEEGKYRLCGLAAVRSAIGLVVEDPLRRKVKKAYRSTTPLNPGPPAPKNPRLAPEADGLTQKA